MDYTQNYSSPLGPILLASDGQALTGLWFAKQKYFADNLTQQHHAQDLPIFAQTRQWLDTYFNGQNPSFTPPLSLRGSNFSQTVWRILLDIPFGKTTTYGQIAQLLTHSTVASRMSAQAVGNAVSRNPISLIVPCHRVIGSRGQLTGYAGGLTKKAALLRLEQTTHK